LRLVVAESFDLCPESAYTETMQRSPLYNGIPYQLTEEIGNTSIGNIGNKSIEKESPSHRIQKRLLNLIQLEVLVSNTLLVNADTSNSQDAIFLVQPARIELVIWHNPEENQTKTNGQQAGNKEDDFPRLDGGAVLFSANSDPVGYYTAENLAYAVEAEPDVDTASLFVFRVPLSPALARSLGLYAYSL